MLWVAVTYRLGEMRATTLPVWVRWLKDTAETPPRVDKPHVIHMLVLTFCKIAAGVSGPQAHKVLHYILFRTSTTHAHWALSCLMSLWAGKVCSAIRATNRAASFHSHTTSRREQLMYFTSRWPPQLRRCWQFEFIVVAPHSMRRRSWWMLAGSDKVKHRLCIIIVILHTWAG